LPIYMDTELTKKDYVYFNPGVPGWLKNGICL